MDNKIYNKLLYYFTNSIIKVWGKLTDVPIGKPRIENVTGEAFTFTGYVSTASFGGGVSGRVIVALNEECASVIGSVLSGKGQNNTTSEILFSLAEFLNIINGNAVSSFNNEFEDKRIILSPPSAVYGKNLRFINFKIKGFNVVFPAGKNEIILNLVISEEKR